MNQTEQPDRAGRVVDVHPEVAAERIVRAAVASGRRRS